MKAAFRPAAIVFAVTAFPFVAFTLYAAKDAAPQQDVQLAPKPQPETASPQVGEWEQLNSLKLELEAKARDLEEKTAALEADKKHTAEQRQKTDAAVYAKMEAIAADERKLNAKRDKLDRYQAYLIEYRQSLIERQETTAQNNTEDALGRIDDSLWEIELRRQEFEERQAQKKAHQDDQRDIRNRPFLDPWPTVERR